jgi:hypothetical protein
MASRSKCAFHRLTFLLLLVLLSLPIRHVQALSDDYDSSSLPTLEDFVGQVLNGQPGELRGIYIASVLAAPIVQQPPGTEEFVSPWQNIVTEFGLATRFGSTGLLAHNYLAGQSFYLLQPGQPIHLIYGDGQVDTFIVSEILHYRALEPDSTSSSFVNLDTFEAQTHASLFSWIYNRPGHVVFQTCISTEDDLAWGRLFIIAQPAS